MTDLGHTGQFPEGQLVPDDRGELLFEVGEYEGKIILNFGDTPIQALGMTPDQADFLADALKERAAYIRSTT